MADVPESAGGTDVRPSASSASSDAALSGNDRLFIGGMSGTSADGVDVALVAVAGRGDPRSGKPPPYICRFIRHHHVPYDQGLREAIFSMRQSGQSDLRTIARLTRDVSTYYARAVTELLAAAKLPADAVSAVAAHGQTLFHEPPCTIQAFDPSLLAEEVGCTVVSDFRRADCAAGGQGAPLVPFADYILFRDPVKSRVLLNIGGIANVTCIPAGGSPADVIAFDTGPGNCVSDHLVRLYDPQGSGFDRDGELASHGEVIDPLMQLMLGDPYFAAAPPKSTDGPAMIALFTKASEALGRKFRLEDLVRTACFLSATAITDAIRRFRPLSDELIVSGGGTRNRTLMSLLCQTLRDMPVRTIDELGVPSEAKEAMAFALLGAATLDRVPGNLPTATGAKRAVVLGSVT